MGTLYPDSPCGNSMMIKRLSYNFPEVIKAFFQEIYYNEFAIFVITEIEKKEDFFYKYKESESFISAYIQNNPYLLEEYFKDRDVIWDIYLFLIIDFEIEPEVKNRIENDRFYCKKNIMYKKPGFKAKEYLQCSTLFTTFLGTDTEDGFISRINFEKELLSGLNFTDLAVLFSNEDFINLETDEIKKIVDNWVTEVEKDV